jgi:hypothetical protein
MKQSDINFLNDNRSIWDAQKVGSFKHLSEATVERLNSIAKSINPEVTFQLRECQSCINELVKFVYSEFERKGKAVRMKFPKEAK